MRGGGGQLGGEWEKDEGEWLLCGERERLGGRRYVDIAAVIPAEAVVCSSRKRERERYQRRRSWLAVLVLHTQKKKKKKKNKSKSKNGTKSDG